MKKMVLLFLVGAFLMTFSQSAEAQNMDGVTLSIKTGNAGELAKFLDTKVELTILDKESQYSKAQAEMVLRDFFSKYSPKSYSVVHKGSSGQGSYNIGTLVTSNGTFRTYVYGKQKGNSFLVQEIRFEAE